MLRGMNDDQRLIDDDQRLPTSDRPVYESVKDAARRMGLSDNAVRLRIKRGTLPAEKIGDNWFVAVGDDQRPTTDQRPVISQTTTTDQSRPTTTDRLVDDQSLVVAERIRVELETIREEWLQPLIDQIRELEHDRGRLESEHDRANQDAEDLRQRAVTAESERDALRSRVSDLEAQQAESPIEPTSMPETQPRRTWWQFWKQD